MSAEIDVHLPTRASWETVIFPLPKNTRFGWSDSCRIGNRMFFSLLWQCKLFCLVYSSFCAGNNTSFITGTSRKVGILARRLWECDSNFEFVFWCADTASLQCYCVDLVSRQSVRNCFLLF